MAGSFKRNLLFGLAAGLAGTAAMNAYWAGLSKIQPAAAGSSEEPATEKLGRRGLRRLGVKSPSKQTRAAAGQVVHWGYGASWGLATGLARWGGVPLAWGGGQLLGTGLWAAGDIWMLYKLRLARHPREYPVQIHAIALGAHLAYGLGLWAAYKGLERLELRPSRQFRRVA